MSLTWKRGLGIGLLFIGLFMALTSRVLTGAVIGSLSEQKNYIGVFGLIVFIVGVFLVFVEAVAERRKHPRADISAGLARIVSRVKDDPTLSRKSREIEGNTSIQRDINHLLLELVSGNENPGIGTRTLFKNIKYLRGKNGGRIYFRDLTDGYEILAYAIGTGQGNGKSQHERSVIRRLEQLYS